MRRAAWASRAARVLFAAVGFLLIGASAWAYWSTTGDSAASVTTASFEAPTDVAAAVRGTTVDVSWTPPSSGAAADGYYVTRQSGGITSSACGTSPESPATASSTSCSDVAVPDGTYTYAVTAVLATWTASSDPSDSATVVSASALDFTTQPSNGTSESTLDAQPVVVLRDANGDPVMWDSSTVVALALTTPNGATLTCDTNPVTASSGMAAFTGCEVDKAGTYTLTATSPGLFDGTSASFTVTAGPATRVAFTRQPSDSTGGVSLASQPQVAVKDAWGNTVTTDTSTITLALTPSGSATLTCSGGLSKAATAGSASFSSCKVDRPDDYTLTATSGSLTSAVSTEFTITVGPASKLLYTTQPSATATSEVDLAVQPALVLQDAGGNVVTDDSSTDVTLALTAANGAVLSCDTNPVTAASGIVELTGCQVDKAATYTLKATATGVTSATSTSVVVSAGPATRLAFTTQPSNSTGGVVLATQPVVKVLDNYGNPILTPVSSVALALTPANGATLTCTANPKATSAGVSTFAACKVDRPGDYTFTATNGSLTPAVSDSFTITVGPASKLLYTRQPSTTATSEVDLAVQPALVLQDAGGNVVTDDSSTQVTLALTTPNGAVLSCDTNPVTAASGIVEFTGCQVDKAATYTLKATAPNVTLATSTSVVVSAGPATRLAFTTQPSNSTGGVVLATQPVVKVLDNYGNPILTPVSSVTLALTPANGATLTCTANPKTTSSGVSTFAACKVDRPGDYTFTATNGSLTPAVSNSFTITVGPATKLVYTTQPSATATSQVALATQPVVTVQDVGGNTVTTDSSTVVTLALTAPGGAVLNCDSTAVTASSGVVAFTGCDVDKVATYTLLATTSGLTSATSTSVVVSAGPATRLAFTTQPSSGTGGVVLTTQPIVKVLDSYGNTVLSPVSSVALALTTPNGAALTCTTNPRSTVSGVATFAACKVDKPGTYTFTATNGSLTPAVSNSFTITVGPATKLVYTTLPSSTATSGVALATQPALVLQDAGGNVVTADSSTVVTLALVTPNGAILSCDTNPVTASSGVVAFAGCKIDKAGTYTVRASALNIATATSGNVVVSASSATRLAFTTQPSDSTGGVALTTQPVVKALDSYGNTVSTPTNSVALALTTPNGAALSCTTNPLTTVSGIATFVGCKVDRPGTYTLTATSGSLTSAVSTSFTITVGPASKLSFTTQPSATATSQVPLGTQPVVTVQDAGGNTIVGDSRTVSLALTTPAGAILTCDTTTVAASSGVSAFTGCQIDKSGSYTLSATASGVTLGTSTNVVVSAGPATRLAFTTQPSNGTGGVAPIVQPVVRIQDVYGNTVTTDTSTVTIALTTPNGAVLTCTTSNFRAAVAGTATFAGCKVDKTGTYTLTATDGSLTSAVSASFTITVGPATKLGYAAQPSSSAVSQVALANQPVVAVQDAGGNTVTTDSSTVTLALTTPAPPRSPVTPPVWWPRRVWQPSRAAGWTRSGPTRSRPRPQGSPSGPAPTSRSPWVRPPSWASPRSRAPPARARWRCPPSPSSRSWTPAATS